MQSPADLARVPAGQIDQAWPYARDLIARAMVRGGGASDFARVEREVLSGLQVLWLAHAGGKIEAAAVTQLISVDGRKICIIVACGGIGRARWLPLIAQIEDHAKTEACSAMRVAGRPGWQRVLKGYGVKYVTLEKEI